MNEETYKMTLNNYDLQILEIEKKIRDLSNEIAEVEEAIVNAKGIRDDFDYFVSMKKRKNSEQTKDRHIKSFSSFMAKATALLTGSDYNQADERILEINRLLSSKIKSLNDDLDYCKRELSRLRQQQNALRSEYMEFLKSLEEEVE